MKEEGAYSKRENNMSDQTSNIYQRAVDTYGDDAQLIMCIEEMAELTQEISKHFRGKTGVLRLADEMADVEIMLEQLKLIFKNSHAVEMFKTDKLKRLEERLNEKVV